MSTKDKSALDQTFDGIRDGHTAVSDEQWQQRFQHFLENQSDVSKPVLISNIARPKAGFSAVNIIFSARTGGTEQRYVARVAPESSIYVNYNLLEQFEAYRYLNSIGLPVPRSLWMDDDGKYLGRPGFVMEFWPGESSTSSYFTDGPLSRADDEQRFRMLRHMVETIADFHAKADPTAIKSLANKWRGTTWIEREINFWGDLASGARPELSKFYDPVRDWLIANAPSVSNPVFLHGDLYGSNVLWQGETISAILDLESLHIGPRESDVVYQYLIDYIASSFFTHGITVPSLAQRAEWYEAASGVKLDNLDYHEIRMTYQLAAAGVAIARNDPNDLSVTPSAYMNFLNRRLMALQPFKHQMPILNT